MKTIWKLWRFVAPHVCVLINTLSPLTTSLTRQCGSILPICLGWAGFTFTFPPKRSARRRQRCWQAPSITCYIFPNRCYISTQHMMMRVYVISILGLFQCCWNEDLIVILKVLKMWVRAAGGRTWFDVNFANMGSDSHFPDILRGGWQKKFQSNWIGHLTFSLTAYYKDFR